MPHSARPSTRLRAFAASALLGVPMLASAQAQDIVALDAVTVAATVAAIGGPGLRAGAAGPGAWARDGRAALALERPQRSVAISGTVGRRSRTLWQATWRETDPSHDDRSFATAALQARHRNLVARFTYRDGDARDWHALAEWSTARPSSATLPNATFRFAVGLDKLLTHGAWVELRAGKRRIALDDRDGGAIALSLRLASGSP